MITETLQSELDASIRNLQTRGWARGVFEDSSGHVDSHGAVQTCEGVHPGDAYIIRAVMHSYGFDEKWDRGQDSESVVVDHLRSIEITDEVLEETFGPQWRNIVWIIRRAAILTRDEEDSLDIAQFSIELKDRYEAEYVSRVASWDSDRAQGRGSHWNLNRSKVWDAAWNSARYAAWNVAEDESANAAGALAVSDLVGQHGLEQRHIDILLEPWMKAIGEIGAEE